MKRFLVLSMLLALPLAAQEQKKADDNKPSDKVFTPEKAFSPAVQKLFILKYADPAQLKGLLTVFGANVTPNVLLHALAVVTSPEIMPAIEDAIKRLDVPTQPPPEPKNIELTAYFVIGGDSETVAGSAPPKDLDSVVTQLRNSFPFKNYRVMDVLTLRTREMLPADSTGTPGGLASGLPDSSTSFRIRSAQVNGNSVRLDGMKASARVAMPAGQGPSTNYQFQNLALDADVDVKEGQKVVVGRLSIHDQALFLVLTAHVVN